MIQQNNISICPKHLFQTLFGLCHLNNVTEKYLVDKNLSQEYKDKCADLNDGKWTKSSKGGDVLVVDGHGYLIKYLRKYKAGKITVYPKCVNSSCAASNRLVDGILFDKDHKSHSCSPDPTLFERLDVYSNLKLKAATSDKAPSN